MTIASNPPDALETFSTPSAVSAGWSGCLLLTVIPSSLEDEVETEAGSPESSAAATEPAT